jgi:hypothetical protein
VTCPISADRDFSIEIRPVADLKIKNLEIVNKNANHVDFYLNSNTITLKLAI